MKIGDKAFVVTGMSENDVIHTAGIVTKVTDYVSVAGEPYISAFVFLDTEENRALYNAHTEAMKKWRKLEPNMFSVLNRMAR